MAVHFVEIGRNVVLVSTSAHVTISGAKPRSSDKAIRKHLLAELNKQSWAPAALINVFVKDGVVRFSGAITDERECQALKLATENVLGVKEC